ALLRELEGEADDALGGLPRDDPVVDRDLLAPAGGEDAAGAAVEALGVLADDDHVDLVRVPHPLLAAMDPVRHAGIELHRPNVGVQIEARAVADDRRPARHLAVLHRHRGAVLRRPAHGAEEDHVRRRTALLRPFRPVARTMREVELSPTRDVLDLEVDAGLGSDRAEDAEGLRHPLGAGSGARKGDDMDGRHGPSLARSWVAAARHSGKLSKRLSYCRLHADLTPGTIDPSMLAKFFLQFVLAAVF